MIEGAGPGLDHKAENVGGEVSGRSGFDVKVWSRLGKEAKTAFNVGVVLRASRSCANANRIAQRLFNLGGMV